MTEKELKKLTRYQLLELLIIQTERADKLQQQLEKAQSQLNEQEIQMTVLGSIAEAADLYLEAAQKKAEQLIHEAEAKARELTQEPEPDPERAEKIWGMLEEL